MAPPARPNPPPRAAGGDRSARPAAPGRRTRAALSGPCTARARGSGHGRARSGAHRPIARRTARPAGALRRLRAEGHRHPTGVCRRQSAGAADVRRRGARPRRRHRGPALRRPLRQTARPHARRHRPRPHASLHRQHRALAAARQPHADAAGIRRFACRSCCARSSSPIPKFWSVSAGPRRRRCSASKKASPVSAGAGSPSTPESAKSAPCRRFIRLSCCAAHCRNGSPGAIFSQSRKRSASDAACETFIRALRAAAHCRSANHCQRNALA